MSTAPGNLSTVIGAILDDVKQSYWAANGDVNIFGPRDDFAQAGPRSIYWAPDREGTWLPAKRQGQIGTAGALWTRPIVINFMLFGGLTTNPTWVNTADTNEQAAARATMHDADETEALLANLVNAIHRKVGGTFNYSDPSVEWFMPGRDGIGMSCEFKVTIYLPLVREDNPTVTVTGLNPTPEIVHP